MHHLKVKNEEKILGGGPQREIPYTLDPTFNFGACSAQSHSAAPYRAPTQPPDFPPPIIVLRHGRVFCAPQKKTHSYPFSELGMSEFAWDSRVRTVISQGGGGYSLYIYIYMAYQKNIRVSGNPTDPRQKPPTQKSLWDFWANIGFSWYFMQKNGVNGLNFHVFFILSRASEMGSPTNPPWAPGSDKTQGQGSFGPFTGGLPTQNFKKKQTAHLIRFLLRQGEPGTSQYIYVDQKQLLTIVDQLWPLI